uniref:C2H2-type domain-containing protein n=1 Tax=Anguilla anguilla TaxID=7936 RepID=A0A0E9PUQ1_ANGAN
MAETSILCLFAHQVFICSLCNCAFCVECDIFIHEASHCCPLLYTHSERPLRPGGLTAEQVDDPLDPDWD